MHHAALCMDAEFECGGDKALEQGMSAVGAALELGVELCAQMEVTAGQLHGLHQTAVRKMHWRQGILLAEIGILAIVGFIPNAYNMIATVMVSFACAMQVQTFRKVGGYSYASTMCIGNLRSGTAALSLYLRDKKAEHLRQTFYYFGIIFFFAIGAGIGGILSVCYGIHVIWISCILLFISFLLMFLEKLR